MKIPTITTRRLVLRPFTERDVGPLHRILCEEGVLRYFPNPNPPARDAVERFVVDQLRRWWQDGFGWWAVTPRSRRALIGWNGLQFLPETNEVEVGFLLSREFWGRGLALEGALAGLKYGFDTLGLESIIALVHPENRASRRVIEKLGMSFVDRARYFGMEVDRYRIAGGRSAVRHASGGKRSTSGTKRTRPQRGRRRSGSEDRH
ncbi:MAG: GNAT family N-acetyltransferase [Planctomycetota bacterium]|nr:GNAT family N-acetyltransferase [Planctomycetota bacterium]